MSNGVVKLGLPEGVVRSSRRFFNQRQLARFLNIDVKTLRKLERDPLSVNAKTLWAYLNFVGWRIVFRRTPHADQ